ncbi:MAG: BON domain-containing protein [Syntrophothermus sp.]
MRDQNQNPGRKWRTVENDGDGNTYFDTFRFTPYTTDTEFFRDPSIYETEVSRNTEQKASGSTDTRENPRGLHRSDDQIRDEVDEMLAAQGQIDASHIHVDVKDRVVTLLGSVPSEGQVPVAERIAENVLGVLDVNNQLQVRAQAAEGPGR